MALLPFSIFKVDAMAGALAAILEHEDGPLEPSGWQPCSMDGVNEREEELEILLIL